MRISRTNLILMFILALGLFLRLWGINFGLPELYHADEPIVVNHAMAYGTGDLNPHFFMIPPLVSYFLFFLYGLYFLIGRLLGIFHSPDDLAFSFVKDPTVFYLIGRIFAGVLLGIFTVIAVYVLASRIFSRKAGIISAIFMATVFIHVQNSHYIYADIPMVFFVVLTCIAAQRIIREPSCKSYVFAGIFSGLAASAKYNGILVFITVIIATLFFNRTKSAIRKLALSIFSCAATFIITNPFSILDARLFITETLSQSGAEAAVGILYHLNYSLTEGVGLAFLFLGLAGMLAAVLRRSKTDLVFISFPLFFYLSLTVFSQPHERYALPLVPFILIYASVLLEKVIKNKIILGLCVIFAITPGLAKSLYSDYLFSRKDNRTVAELWIEQNIPAGSTIAVENSFFCPRLRQDKGQLKEKLISIKENSAKKKKARLELELAELPGVSYRLFYLRDPRAKGRDFLSEQPRLPFLIPELRKNGVKYVVIHIDRKEGPRINFYRDLVKEARLVREFSPYKDSNRQYAYDRVPQTAGPFLSEELFSRNSNGYIIKIFKLD